MRLGPIASTIQGASRFLAYLSGIAVVLLIILNVAQVVMRNVFGRTLGSVAGWLGEPTGVSVILLVVIVFFGLPYGVQVDSHVKTDLLTSRLRPRQALAARLLTTLLGIFVISWVAIEGFHSARDAQERGEVWPGLGELPLWPARYAVPIGLGLLALELLLSAVRAARGHRDQEPISEDGPPLTAQQF